MISLVIARFGEWQRGSAHRQVVSAAAVVAIFTLGAKLAGAVKEVVVAHHFGTSADVDAFIIAFLMPSFAISVIGGSLNTALIPTYVEVRQREGPEAAQRMLSSIMVISLALLVAAAVALGLLVPTLLPVISPRLEPSKLQLTARLSYLLMPCLVVAGTTMTWSAVLNAHGRFAPSAAASLALPITTVAALLALGRSWGIYALAAGMLGGYCIEALLVGRALHRQQLATMPRWSGLSPAVRRVIGQYAPMVAGMVAMDANPVVNSLMAAHLGAGSVAALGYGGKLEAFAVGIGAVSISAAVLPHFSRLAAAEDWPALQRTIRTYAVVLVLAAVPVTIAAIWLSEPIIRAVFERGAFTSADTVLVARIQSFYLAALPFRFAGLLFVRFMMAVKATRALMWIAIACSVVNVAGNFLFSRFLGVAGIALSTTVVLALSTSLAFAFTRQRLRALNAQAAIGTSTGDA
jgi:putative peptidoglycan lipid II flippase